MRAQGRCPARDWQVQTLRRLPDCSGDAHNDIRSSTVAAVEQRSYLQASTSDEIPAMDVVKASGAYNTLI
ncbi:hypothetical protein H2248_008976 [Termitomyces sp. 'cryptogamus']|nr:hypothetical protein H2248_008976 [Termitomyces sp. 'cryptogamus']